MTPPVGAAALAHLREGEIQAWSGSAAFERADAWQRAGHVGQPTLLDGGISADVLGTWRRVDHVVVSADAKHVETTCTCTGGNYCRHAAAVLLHWIREPRSFTRAPAEPYYASAVEPSPPAYELVNAADQIVSFLEGDTLTHVRDIARRRGLHVRGRTKSEVAVNLGSDLADPGSIDAALAALTLDERAMLEAVDLIDERAQGAGTALDSAYRAFGGQDDANSILESLVGVGLVFGTDRAGSPFARYTVPRAVAERIPLEGSCLSSFVRPTGSWPAHGEGSNRRRLSLGDLCYALVHEVSSGRIGQVLPTVPTSGTATPAAGWTAIPPDMRSSALFGSSQSTHVALVPQPHLLSDDDLRDMAARSGHSVEAIDFVLRILSAWNIFEYAPAGRSYRLIVHLERWQDRLKQPREEQHAALVQAWLSLNDAFDFREIVGPRTSLQLRITPRPVLADPNAVGPRGANVRRVMARLLARLAGNGRSDDAYDLESWLDMLWQLAPDLLGDSDRFSGDWWFTTSPDGGQLNLSVREHWQAVWEPLVRGMLTGLMTWLDLVEIEESEEGRLRFHPAAHDTDADRVDQSITFGLDPDTGAPEIFVPSGYPFPAEHGFLAEASDLVDISPDGFRYRLTRARVEDLFASGMTGPTLLAVLADRTGVQLPDDVAAALRNWWEGYGTIRLYDDLTLIELDDDILHEEILATSSLRAATIDVITPRLVAIDPARVAPLLGELERLGYMPRVLEDA